MKHALKSALVAAALALGPQPVFATSSLPDESHAEVAVQPGAVTALDRMASFLRTLKSFTLTATTRKDDVLDDHEKLEVGGVSIYKSSGNDRLFLSKVDDRSNREFYFNGKTLTQYAPALKLYASVPAPATTVEMLDLAVGRFGMEIPLADLFYWGTPRSNVKSLKSAFFVGEAMVNGAVCDQYAYRTPAVDFQVWIRKEGEPLPCKLVVTDRRDPTWPQYSATLAWSLNDTFDDKTFTFTAPDGAREIKIVADPTN